MGMVILRRAVRLQEFWTLFEAVQVFPLAHGTTSSRMIFHLFATKIINPCQNAMLLKNNVRNAPGSCLADLVLVRVLSHTFNMTQLTDYPQD